MGRIIPKKISKNFPRYFNKKRAVETALDFYTLIIIRIYLPSKMMPTCRAIRQQNELNDKIMG